MNSTLDEEARGAEATSGPWTELAAKNMGSNFIYTQAASSMAD